MAPATSYIGLLRMLAPLMLANSVHFLKSSHLLRYLLSSFDIIGNTSHDHAFAQPELQAEFTLTCMVE